MGKRHEQQIYDKLAIEFLNGKTLTTLQKETGITRQCLSENFKRMGIEITNSQNKIKFDQHIFDEIDTEEKAYWLGFIFADGYIEKQSEKKHYGFELSLKLSDKEHLEKFSQFIQYKNLVRTDSYRARCIFTNKHL